MNNANFHITRRDWLMTPGGEPRGHIETGELRELWFHTGTICNLRCPFCFEGSKPGDNRLEQMALADVVPLMDAAVKLGVRMFGFTGGEPFVVQDFMDILREGLTRKPCLVLTNGTEPLLNRLDEVLALRNSLNPVRFRISVDYPDELRHDAGRGIGNFRRSMAMLARLSKHGFPVSLARQGTTEDSAEVDHAFRRHFRTYGIPEDTAIIWFPDFHSPGALPDVPHITEDCMTRYHTEMTRSLFMCSYSKMAVKRGGKVMVSACTLVDDDPDFDLADNLADAVKVRIMLKHHRCYSCFATGCRCGEPVHTP